MKDYQKTNIHFNHELSSLQQQVEQLEARVSKLESSLQDNLRETIPRSPRTDLNTAIEFIGDFDIIQAKGINISETGVCFELEDDLPFEMQFELEGKRHRYRAHLIWVKRLPEGGYRFGLKFVEPEPYPEL